MGLLCSWQQGLLPYQRDSLVIIRLKKKRQRLQLKGKSHVGGLSSPYSCLEQGSWHRMLRATVEF